MRISTNHKSGSQNKHKASRSTKKATKYANHFLTTNGHKASRIARSNGPLAIKAFYAGEPFPPEHPVLREH